MTYSNSIGTGTVEQNQEMLNSYLHEWCGQIEKNLSCRFQVDYRTIDKEWINTLRHTYRVWSIKDMNLARTKSIRRYVNYVKKNKIIIKASNIVVEPSTLYYDWGFKIRSYVRFQLVSSTIKKPTSDDLLYSGFSEISGMKKGIWLERYFDVMVVPVSNNSYGEGYYVTDDDYLFEDKDSIPND